MTIYNRYKVLVELKSLENFLLLRRQKETDFRIGIHVTQFSVSDRSKLENFTRVKIHYHIYSIT